MVLRKPTIHDLEKLSVIFDKYRVFYNEESDLMNTRKFIRNRLLNNDSEFFVCENSDCILVGFIQLYPIFSSTKMKKLWLLNDLYVEFEFRGNGISILLIDKAKELSKKTNACGLILETEKSNIIGNKLYSKTNFKLDELHNYYFWTPVS
jgi:ribosomal protein S18 acetylase RimI-like enzyme